ncbi:MAG: DUF1549 domain-containing protein [Pirellulaceae bacterium]
MITTAKCRSAVAMLLMCATAVCGQDQLSARIDQLIEAKVNGKVAGPASDAEFLRRSYLDLNGIVPTAAQVRTFLADKNPQKRSKLIDQLLNNDAYSRRFREAFTVMLLERRTGATVPIVQWNLFLESSFAKNKPWDQFVREIIQADAGNDLTQGSLKFFTATGRTAHDQMTQDVARLFLGMNIHCAKCHDHPTVDEFKQADYFGLLAFLNQSKAAKHTGKNQTFLVEGVATGKLEFQSVFSPEKKDQVGPRLPGGQEVEVPVFEKGEELAQPAADGLPGVPKFQPRQILAKELTSASNRRFVENSVNRFWYLMMGRGLVHPLEMMHAENPASHPELLKILTDEFVAHNFDVKWLLGVLARTRVYQRASLLPAGVAVQDATPESYRVANAKGMTPEQTAWSIMRVTGVLEEIVKKERPEDSGFNFKDYINGRIPAPDNLTDTMLLFTSVFGNPPGEAEVEFQPSMGQALFLMNERLILDWLKPVEGRFIGRVEKMKDPKQVAEELFITILARNPSEQETNDLLQHLEKNASRRTAAISEYAWALITSAEFKLNH